LDQIIAPYAPLSDGGVAAAVIYTSDAETTIEVERAPKARFRSPLCRRPSG